jgi:hypothetical protein
MVGRHRDTSPSRTQGISWLSDGPFLPIKVGRDAQSLLIDADSMNRRQDAKTWQGGRLIKVLEG